MAAAQAAFAPQNKKADPRKNTSGTAEVRKPAISRPVGIALMVLLLCLSLVIGNGRALSKATPKAFIRQGSVASLVDERATSAKNAVSVAKRADLEQTIYDAVTAAADALARAKTAREISVVDQKLMSAVGEMTMAAEGYLGKDVHLTSAMDTFNDAGNMLRFEAQEYNQKAAKAQRIYEGLPLKMLFGQPDYYEGI